MKMEVSGKAVHFFCVDAGPPELLRCRPWWRVAQLGGMGSRVMRISESTDLQRDSRIEEPESYQVSGCMTWGDCPSVGGQRADQHTPSNALKPSRRSPSSLDGVNLGDMAPIE